MVTEKIREVWPVVRVLLAVYAILALVLGGVGAGVEVVIL